MTNDHLYAETPERLITRLNRVPIQSASFASASAGAVDDPGLIAGDQETVIALAGLPAERELVDEANNLPGSDGSARISSADLSSGEIYSARGSMRHSCRVGFAHRPPGRRPASVGKAHPTMAHSEPCKV
jgi:hypothetical protein